LQRMWVVFKGGEGNIVLYKITKMPWLMPLVLGVSIFGSVQFWAKINNQTKIIFFEPNRTDNGLNRPCSVWFVFFFSIPNRFKPKLFQLSFYSRFFTDHIFLGILLSSCF
jgi:hypothetical protein